MKLFGIIFSMFSLSNAIILDKPVLKELGSKQFISYKPSQLISDIGKQTKNNFGQQWTLNDFMNEAAKNHIESATIVQQDDNIKSIVAIDNFGVDGIPGADNIHLVQTGIDKFNDIALNTLIDKNIYYDIFNVQHNGLETFFNIFQNIVVIYILFTLLSVVFRTFGGGGMPGMGGFGGGQLAPKNDLINPDDIDIRFDDVAGCDEAKYELEEVVEFLKDPEKFSVIGAKVPKGVLLEGPPGTGKTLLARAVAGEAGVSYISVSASQFIEMFVGLGASRVRKLFETARQNKPCVIFIDEIDAIGKKRGSAFSNGGNEEREQTLNQILTNMDGFDKDEGIIIIGATNRIDILDDALVRSGRFDRKIKVSLPDEKGREKILKVHLKNKLVDNNIDYDQISRLTSGFSGADLANIANEAAILAVRDNKTFISNKYLLDAFEKITIGLPKNNDLRDNKTLSMIAYHEMGHALTANLFKSFFNINKVTINANNNGAGGFTLFTPNDEYINYPTKKYLLANMIVAMGGRAAEVIFYNKTDTNLPIYNEKELFSNIKNLDITTGSSNDLIQTNNLARQYIDLFGVNNFERLDSFSRELNNFDYSHDKLEIYKKDDNFYSPNTLSENSKYTVDYECSLLINYAYNRAIDILVKNKDLLIESSNKLLREKTLNSTYFDNLYCSYY
uniref:ATP-dependent zinc metalloprotease n=1 Tax=Nucleocytoviricota sp. TaxID=2809609 RepID=A0A9E8JZC8_9VIRU|nr:ATP-dependent zinc metalloprotease [Nucleocytoviricota sp.]UZT29252.1 ATP-dependent zinc metalloprotease [Nucleocytoviricota sp.]